MDNTAAPFGIAAWLGCFAFVIMITYYVIQIFKDVKGKPGHPPAEQLQQSHDSLTERVQRLEEWKEVITEKMDSDKTEILAAGEKRSVAIHERINAVLIAVSRLEGTCRSRKNCQD